MTQSQPRYHILRDIFAVLGGWSTRADAAAVAKRMHGITGAEFSNMLRDARRGGRITVAPAERQRSHLYQWSEFVGGAQRDVVSFWQNYFGIRAPRFAPESIVSNYIVTGAAA